MTPVEILSFIQNSETMDLSGYSNPLASIHTTLKLRNESPTLKRKTALPAEAEPSATHRLAYTKGAAGIVRAAHEAAEQYARNIGIDPDRLPPNVKAALLGKVGKK